MKRTFSSIFLLFSFLFLSLSSVLAQNPQAWKPLKGTLNFFVCNDTGRNGYYSQKPIAVLMGQMAETFGPECVFAAGDVHHFDGVQSTADPLWLTNYEQIYSHPELMIPWHPVLGNHEYRGNTQAVLDYSSVSRRWQMPARYYSKVFSKKDLSIRFVMLDTTPLIERYREDTLNYPDAARQSREAQLEWLDRTLSDAREDWVIVIGHHPILAETPKDVCEREDMQRHLLPIFEKHPNASLYVCGHIHNFQHLRRSGFATDFIVNSAGALSRKVKETEETVFCSPLPGFSVISATRDALNLHFIDKDGKVIHTVSRTK
ncbi:MAG: metallophosphoesterase [Alloprevotella sp.]